MYISMLMCNQSHHEEGAVRASVTHWLADILFFIFPASAANCCPPHNTSRASQPLPQCRSDCISFLRQDQLVNNNTICFKYKCILYIKQTSECIFTDLCACCRNTRVAVDIQCSTITTRSQIKGDLCLSSFSVKCKC